MAKVARVARCHKKGSPKARVHRVRKEKEKGRKDRIQATIYLGALELHRAGSPSLWKGRTLGTRPSATAEREEAKYRTGGCG